MRIYALSDDRDTLTGLRLAGIEGSYAAERREIAACVERIKADSDIAVLLINEGCASKIPETVTQLQLSGSNPLLVVIPGSTGSNREPDSITRLIREAIGIKI